MAIDVDATYRRYGPMVIRRCRRLLHDEHLALDAMHDVFVNVLLHRTRLDERALASLLFRIATNVCLNRLRARSRRPEDSDPDLVERIAGVGEEPRSLARNLLEMLFGREPVSSQELAFMHLLDGMTLEEVAREAGLSVSGVRKRLRKLRSRLTELEEV